MQSLNSVYKTGKIKSFIHLSVCYSCPACWVHLSTAMWLQRMRCLLPHCCYSTNSGRPSQLQNGPGLRDFIPSSGTVAPATGLAEVGGRRVPYLRDEDMEGQGRKGEHAITSLWHKRMFWCETPALFHIMCSCKNLELLHVDVTHTADVEVFAWKFHNCSTIKPFFMDVTFCCLEMLYSSLLY